MNARSIVLLLFLAPAVLAAQEPSVVAPSLSPDATLEPAAIRDAVSHINDAARLRDLEASYLRENGNGTGDDESVAAGLVALRLWELTSEREDARRARRHFDRAADANPSNAWAHYGHALSLQGEMGREPGFFRMHVNAVRDLGFDPASRARRALERAVALDPSLPGAVELLARFSAETNDDDGLAQARAAFESMISDSTASVSDLLGASMTARELGDYHAAATMARRATTIDASSAQAWLELSLALASIEDSLASSAVAYENALQLADSAMLERLWDDAAILQNSRETGAFRFADLEKRREMIRTFWGLRGVLGGFTGAERAAEHYRRVAIARKQFPRRGHSGALPRNALVLERTSPDFDDRGVIFIRHGSPVATWGVPPLQPHITWFYRDDQGEVLSYHFFKPDVAGSSKDYLLMRDLPCPIDPDVAALDPRVSPLLWRCDPLNIRSVSSEIDRDARRALGTDTHQQRFLEPMPFHYDWYTFRGDSGTEVLMAVGVPVDQLPAGPRALRITFAVVDTLWSEVAEESVLTEVVEGSDEPGLILRTHVSLIAQPTGQDAYRIGVRDATDARIGTVYGGDIKVPDYRGERIMMSDIMLAEQRDGNFVRGNQRLALSPTNVFPEGAFRVYYELYNLPAGSTYTTELTVERLDNGGLISGIRRLFRRGDSVRLQFEDIAPDDAGATTQQVRDVTAPFNPGRYVLRIRVRTSAGTVSQERMFTIE